MRTVIKVISYLKWIGLLGLPMFISDANIWRILWNFWIFGLIELLFSLPIFLQAAAQIVGMLIVPIINHPVPDLDHYKNKLEYSLPVTDAWVVVNGGVHKTLSHSWHLNSQRYAYDLVVMDEEIRTHCGDDKKLENYYCYGKAIIAPADEKVVEISNRCKDSKIMRNHTTDPLIKDIRGNYIIIQHAKDEFSFIGHLKPDSLRVKVGDQVKRYQKIAECGNSGNTTEPHVHFQIQNRKSFALSAGIPIKFKNIHTEDLEGYHFYDDRALSSESKYDIYQHHYIRRGQRVNNC